MSSRFDIEIFIDKFKTKMQENFKLKIDDINSEKNDDVVLDQFDDASWIFASLDDKAMNFKDFVFYFVDDIQVQISGPRYAEEITLEVDVFIQDTQDLNIQKKILRYSRALREAAADTWGKVGLGYDNANIKFLAPIDVKLNNTSDYYKIFGVSLNFTIVN